MATAMPSFGDDLTPGFSHIIRPEQISSSAGFSVAERGRAICCQLEIGNIVLLAVTPFPIPEEDRALLLGRKQASSAYHKNIAYRPTEDRITGLDASEEHEAGELRRVLRSYSQQAINFVDTVLTPYVKFWKLDYASFRPIEEKGRPARRHAHNDLLHFDSFPTRPTNGARILRVFTNINPAQNRIWLTSQTFESFGPRFANAVGLEREYKGFSITGSLRSVARTLRLPGATRPPYDEFMHRCHNAMKEDAEFQETAPKNRWEFPPNSSWLAFTDSVSHAVLEGQYALEQTFLIPPNALVEKARSPLAILERIAKHPLTI